MPPESTMCVSSSMRCAGTRRRKRLRSPWPSSQALLLWSQHQTGRGNWLENRMSNVLAFSTHTVLHDAALLGIVL